MSSECFEKGLVTGVAPSGQVTVRLRRVEACHNCEAEGACKAFGGKTEDVEISVENTVNAKVGDEVRVSLLESSVIKASAALYLLPAMGLILGAVLGAELLAIWDRDGRALLGAVLGVAIGFGLARWIGSRMSRDVRYLPRLTEIVAAAGESVHKADPD